MSVRHIATRAKWYNNTLLVTCNEDGTIPLNSRIVLEVQEGTPVSENWRALIATAPEMLEALKGLVTVWTAQGPCFCHDYEEFSQSKDGWHSARCRTARAAITGAEGRGA